MERLELEHHDLVLRDMILIHRNIDGSSGDTLVCPSSQRLRSLSDDLVSAHIPIFEVSSMASQCESPNQIPTFSTHDHLVAMELCLILRSSQYLLMKSTKTSPRFTISLQRCPYLFRILSASLSS